MDWRWDPKKDRINKRRHGFGFDLAKLVFADPLAATQPDPYPEEERWQTIGTVDNTVLFVVHTWPEPNEAGSGRIISARRATAVERKAYEEGKS